MPRDLTGQLTVDRARRTWQASLPSFGETKRVGLRELANLTHEVHAATWVVAHLYEVCPLVA